MSRGLAALAGALLLAAVGAWLWRRDPLAAPLVVFVGGIWCVVLVAVFILDTTGALR